MPICQAVDRPVKAFGPDGALRHSRFSQADAQALHRRGVIFVRRWDRTRTRIICIQFYGDSDVLTRPQRWLKTGTRYSYPEMIENRSVWTHKPLPYGMIRRDLNEPSNTEAVNDALRSLFAGPTLSTVATPVPKSARPKPVPIDLRRPRVMAVGAIDEEEPALAA
jgi:hypothetical protein